MALTADGAVHYFELGIVRNLPAPDEIDLPTFIGKSRVRRIVLRKTTFPQGHLYASAFHEPDFQSLPGKRAPKSPGPSDRADPPRQIRS
jgi:hypothetical protein